MKCFEYMRREGCPSIDATPEAEKEWREHVNEVADESLFPEANSWVSLHLLFGVCGAIVADVSALLVFRSQHTWQAAPCTGSHGRPVEVQREVLGERAECVCWVRVRVDAMTIECELGPRDSQGPSQPPGAPSSPPTAFAVTCHRSMSTTDWSVAAGASGSTTCNNFLEGGRKTLRGGRGWNDFEEMASATAIVEHRRCTGIKEVLLRCSPRFVLVMTAVQVAAVPMSRPWSRDPDHRTPQLHSTSTSGSSAAQSTSTGRPFHD